MSLVSKIGGLLSGGLVKSLGDVADRFIQTDAEKQAFRLEMEKVVNDRQSDIEATIQSELQAKERIIVAEMNQSDNYTKRARPTVVYAGLVIIGFNYCLVPAMQSLSGIAVMPFELPIEFWTAWGGCVGIWIIGRSAEKRGANNMVTKKVTGSTTPSLFD